jgi:hypothetical protein
MWKEIATRYRDDENVIGFDIMVEPHGVDSSVWKPFARAMVGGIRAVDPVTPILVSPAGEYGDVDALMEWMPLQGEKIVYTVHQYEPQDYTHGDDQTYDREQLESAYGSMAKWLSDHSGERLAVNEFGVDRTKPRAARFLCEQLNLLESLGVNHAAWLWEGSTTDASYDSTMDFRRIPAQMQVFTENWKGNTIFPATVRAGAGRVEHRPPPQNCERNELR